MNREQEIRQRYVREFVGSDMQWADTVARDVAWLLSELARLRTEAHQMQEAEPQQVRHEVYGLTPGAEKLGSSLTWRQERPTWCPHTDCLFRRRAMDHLCGGELPAAVDHDGTPNTHRLCINAGEPVFDLQVNATDLDWFRWIFDALDGKQTSWLSRAGAVGPAGHGGTPE